jgi:hypothetical protein
MDENIRQYFVRTDTIRFAQESSINSFAIIGLKGAGKTTVYRALTEDWASAGTKRISVGLTTESIGLERQFGQLNCLQFERSVRSGMMFFVLKLLDEQAASPIKDDSLSSWFGRKERLLRGSRLASLLSTVNNLSVMGIGVGWKGDDDKVFEPISDTEDRSVQNLLSSLNGSGLRVRIVVDDPDRLFAAGHVVDAHLLAGYILGTNWISSRFDFVQFVHVLKSNVYDALWDVEELANLPHDYYHYLGWSRAELISLVAARLQYSGVKEQEIFSPSLAECVDEIIPLIRNGPRDLLRYLEIILKSGADKRVTASSVRESQALFKREARRQMESVYSHVYEGVDLFATAMFEGASTIRVGDFERRFHSLRLESRPHGLDYGQHWLKSADRAVRALVEAGVVDFTLGERWVRPFEKDYFRFSSRERTCRLRPNAVFCS